MTTRAIADQCGVEKTSVSRWLRQAGIPLRGSGIGLASRGIEPPTRDELRDMVHVQHLSYRAIAERYGVDFTAIPYWLEAHGIERPSVWVTRRKGIAASEPTEAELRALVESGQSLRFIEQQYDVTRGCLIERCREYGIEVAESGWPDRVYDCADGHKVMSIYEVQVDDWLYQAGIPHVSEPRYPFDKRYRADFGVGDTFIEVWGVTNKASYLERKAAKIARCEVEGLDLIQIHHTDMAQGQKWWQPLERLKDLLGDHS